MPIIKTNIVWAKESYKELVFEDAQIEIENGEIWLRGRMNSSDWHIFSGAYPAYVDFSADIKKSFHFEQANIDGTKVRMNLDGTLVSYRHFMDRLKGYTDYSFKFSDIAYSYNCPEEESYLVLDIPFLHLTSKISDFDHYPQDIIIHKNEHEYRLRPYDIDERTMLVGNVINETAVKDLLVHFSFYFNLIPNVFEKSINIDGRTCVTNHTSQLTFANEALYHSELPYMSFGEEHTFRYFFANSRWSGIEDKDKKKLENAIHTFARCKYYDDVTQFLLLYSILDRFAGNSKGCDPYPVMEDRLKRYNIDIAKIGIKNEVCLQRMKLQLERSNGKKVGVTNFCNLRNYILHFMSNAAIDEYITRSGLIDRMRFAATVIILKELGFEEVQFREGWSHLSVLIGD